VTERENRLEAAAREVLAFKRGEGRYNFSRLPLDQQENEYWDRWNEVEDMISAALALPATDRGS
jgi:hypothetical protein